MLTPNTQLKTSVSKYSSCKHAGETVSLELDKQTGSKYHRGFCKKKPGKIDIDPTCFFCGHYRRKKTTRKKRKIVNATQRARIKRGRGRQTQKKAAAEDWRIRKKTLDGFIKKN